MKQFLLIASSFMFIFSSCGENQSANETEPQESSPIAEDPTDNIAETDERESWLKPHILINQWANHLPGKTIMEYGAKDGFWVYRLAEQGAHIIAADTDASRLAKIKEGAEKRGLQGMVTTRLITGWDPELATQEVDLVMMFDVFSSLPNREEVAQKIGRGLKPEGQLVIIEWLPEQTPHGPPVLERLNGDEIMSEMEAAGYNDVAVSTDFIPEHWVMAAQAFYEEAPKIDQ